MLLSQEQSAVTVAQTLSYAVLQNVQQALIHCTITIDQNALPCFRPKIPQPDRPGWLSLTSSITVTCLKILYCSQSVRHRAGQCSITYTSRQARRMIEMFLDLSLSQVVWREAYTGKHGVHHQALSCVKGTLPHAAAGSQVRSPGPCQLNSWLAVYSYTLLPAMQLPLIVACNMQGSLSKPQI